MASQSEQGPFWLFDWRVNPVLNVIEKEGKSISLEPKVMAVLVTLASKPGEVFSRTDLETQVWQGVIVGYDALAKAINKLREALGDDRKNPRFIQTVSKKGYRLIAEISYSSPSNIPRSYLNRHGEILRVGWRNAALFSAFVILLATLIVWIKAGNEVSGQMGEVAISQKPTIVVLPFRNISEMEKDDYLADGITSDLTTNLSKLSGLWVTASTATQQFKNTSVSPHNIKKQFNADYVISGDVNKFENIIRINVLLTELSQGTVLWAERFDRQFSDLFAIQDEVAQKIINGLSITLTKEEQRRLAKRYTNSLDAYQTFLHAQYLVNARTPEDNSEARTLLLKAITLDPTFARAYSTLSYSYSIGYLRNWPSDTQHPLAKATELAKKAILLDDELPEAYWALSFVNFYSSRIDEGRRALETALDLNPNFADAYALLASHYISQGHPEMALEIMSNAYRLNPIGGYLYDLQLGRIHYFMSNYPLALKYLDSALDRNKTFIDLQLYTAATYVQLGRLDEASWLLIEAKQTNPNFNAEAWAKAYPFLDNKGFRNKLLGDIELASAYENTKD